MPLRGGRWKEGLGAQPLEGANDILDFLVPAVLPLGTLHLFEALRFLRSGSITVRSSMSQNT
jgi:hypothetical protein